jgi:hypothetical protein
MSGRSDIDMSEDRCGTRKNVRGQSFRQSCDGEVAHVLPSSGTGEVEIRKFISKMDMSLDGFVAGPNGESDWIFETCDEGCTLWEVETIWQAGLHVMDERRSKTWQVTGRAPLTRLRRP